MQFTYHQNSGQNLLVIDGDLHKYLFKVRRTKSDDKLFFRNLKDDILYEYEISSFSRRETRLTLINQKEFIVESVKLLHIGWCIVDQKTIEKVIASLNELGVQKISFIYCRYSQKQFKINFDKLNKILINSSQQSGRSSIIKLETFDNLDNFLLSYPHTYMFNFSTNLVDDEKENIKTIIIGCEGGFSNDEKEKVNQDKIVGIKSSLILRSETAVLSVASKILI